MTKNGPVPSARYRPDLLPGLSRGQSALDGARCYDLSHQVVVPLTFHHYMASGPQFEGFDQVVVHVGIDARLFEGVDRSSGCASRNEPGLDIAHGRVRELAQRPEPVCVATDQVGACVAVALTMNE